MQHNNENERDKTQELFKGLESKINNNAEAQKAKQAIEIQQTIDKYELRDKSIEQLTQMLKEIKQEAKDIASKTLGQGSQFGYKLHKDIDLKKVEEAFTQNQEQEKLIKALEAVIANPELLKQKEEAAVEAEDGQGHLENILPKNNQDNKEQNNHDEKQTETQPSKGFFAKIWDWIKKVLNTPVFSTKTKSEKVKTVSDSNTHNANVVPGAPTITKNRGLHQEKNLEYDTSFRDGIKGGNQRKKIDKERADKKNSPHGMLPGGS
jgi:hypothetical protein